jgi:hypothetical protein
MRNEEFCVLVIDKENQRLKFRTEIPCIREINIFALTLPTNEIIILSEDGISVISIFESSKERIIVDIYEKIWKIYPLESCEHLKIEQSNTILVKEHSQNNKRTISI